MLKELVLELIDRPIFYAGDICCLYDSGAYFSVWCSSLKIFKDSFPDAVKLDGKFILRGFGSTKSKFREVEVYCIPELKISDELVFRNVPVALDLDREFGFDLVLSDSMFDKMSCTVDRLESNSPVLRIQHKKDVYHITPIISTVNSNYYTSICNFSQEPVDSVLEKSNIFQ